MESVEIYSDFEKIIAPSTQQAIRRACVNYGAAEANVRWANEGQNGAPVYDIYDERDIYIGSINSADDQVFNREI